MFRAYIYIYISLFCVAIFEPTLVGPTRANGTLVGDHTYIDPFSFFGPHLD